MARVGGSPGSAARPPRRSVLRREGRGSLDSAQRGSESGEDLLAVARREFEEETGHRLPGGPTVELGEIRQKSGKRVLAWAVKGDLDPETAVSNTFEMEWPPRSGRIREFPEIDRVAWFDLKEARVKIKAAQAPFLDRLGPMGARG